MHIASGVDFAELHCLSNFSFLRAASHPQELLQQAHTLGYKALALTDECSVAGVVRAHQYKKEQDLNIKLIIGSEFLLKPPNRRTSRGCRPGPTGCARVP